jgi:LPXTG-motif cell wall-anchored protein
MLTLAEFNLPLLALALVVGLLTGAWMFRRSRKN